MRRVSTCMAVIMAGLLAGCGSGGKTVTVVLKTGSNTTPPPATVPSSASVYKVPSGSMEPTLSIGARVVVVAEQPKVGDIVVFHPPEGAQQQQCGPTHYEVSPGGAPCDQANPEESGQNFIKRIVAGPGDTIYVQEGHAIVNGKRESDSYIKACGGARECNFLTPIKIPAAHWFMMGDDRGESDDSRFWGPVPTSWIVGVVRLSTPSG